MNRRGYFFLIDAVIASVILFVGLFALFGGGVRTESTVQPLATIEDLLGTLASQPISSNLDPYYTSTLLPKGLAPFPELTPLEQIVYLNYTVCSDAYCDEHAANYTKSLLLTTLGSDYGAQISINGSVIARQEHPQRYLIVRGFVVYAKLNETVMIGPLPAEVQLWS